MACTDISTHAPTLRGLVLGILSLAAIQGGRNRITEREFYKGFAALHQRFRDLFPVPLGFRINGDTPYSKKLDNALASCLPCAVGINIESDLIVPGDVAIRNLAWLREFYGDRWVNSLASASQAFITAIPMRLN